LGSSTITLGRFRFIDSGTLGWSLKEIQPPRPLVPKETAVVCCVPDEIDSLQRTAGQSRFDRKQNCSVTITHIPFGPLNVGSRRGFFQWILRINRPVLSFPTLWTPSLAFHSVRQRPIQGGPVRAGLAARNNPDCGSWSDGEVECWSPAISSFIADSSAGLPGNDQPFIVLCQELKP
jgi:hypothetical protein